MKIPNNYKSLTKIAAKYGKRLANWSGLPKGKKQIEAFANAHSEIEKPIIAIHGKGGGTYAHPGLAAIFEGWCNPNYAGELMQEYVDLGGDPNELFEGYSAITSHADKSSVIPDGYESLTEIANYNNKQLSTWVSRKVGLDAIAEFARLNPGIEPIIKKEGKGGGTYAHPELAAIFKVWCDPSYVTDLCLTNENQATFINYQTKVIEKQSEVIEFQRTKIQAMLPFISDAEIQRQMANPMEQRMLSVANPQTDTERVIAWLEKYRQDPIAEKLVKRLIEHPAQINPGTCYDKERWGTKSAFDRACDRWEIFDRIMEMMRGNPYWLKHYGLTQITPIDLEKLINSIE